MPGPAARKLPPPSKLPAERRTSPTRAPHRWPPVYPVARPARADGAPTGWPAGSTLHTLGLHPHTPPPLHSVSFSPALRIVLGCTCPSDISLPSRSRSEERRVGKEC